MSAREPADQGVGAFIHSKAALFEAPGGVDATRRFDCPRRGELLFRSVTRRDEKQTDAARP
jgi:hypothetical protein